MFKSVVSEGLSNRAIGLLAEILFRTYWSIHKGAKWERLTNNRSCILTLNSRLCRFRLFVRREIREMTVLIEVLEAIIQVGAPIMVVLREDEETYYWVDDVAKLLALAKDLDAHRKVSDDKYREEIFRQMRECISPVSPI